MKIKLKRFHCVLFLSVYLCGLFFVPSETASAQPRLITQAKKSSHATPASGGHTTILIQDMSGSMADNDSDNIRCSAANAYIDLSSDGDTIGVVNLSGTEASKLLEPTILRADNREGLKKQLREQCVPGGATPTYSALKLALDMLKGTADNGQQASAILLTDGDPEPQALQIDGQSQTQDELIRKNQLPDFQAHQWPVDTIALGKQIQNAQLLTDIATLTGGTPYATNGQTPDSAVQENSPLNIAPFFLKIFAERKGQQLNQVIKATSVPYQRDFTIPDQAQQYTMIALKDRSDAKIVLKTKGGVQISTADNGNGIFYSEDPHYVILSLSPVNEKNWVIETQGSGKFLMYDFTQSSLGVRIIDPAPNMTLPLNQPIPVTAQLLTDRTTVLQAEKGRYSLYCFIRNGNRDIAELQLARTPSGQYSGSISAAENAAGEQNQSGDYTLHVEVRDVAGGALKYQDQSYHFDFFPEPFFIDENGQHHFTQDRVSQTTTRWPDQLQAASHLPLTMLLSVASTSLFADTPLESSAIFSGDLEREGKIFTGGRVSSASVMLTGSRKRISVPISNDGQGHFRLDFSHLPAGTYTVELNTAGTLGDSWKDYTLQLMVHYVPLWKQLVVWVLFILNILLMLWTLWLLFLLLRYNFYPPVKGGYELVPNMRFPFSGRRGLFKWFAQRNRLYSPHALRSSGPGLELLVNNENSGKVVVRRRGREGQKWFDLNGGALTTQFKGAGGVIYSPTGQSADPSAKIYRFETKGDRPGLPATRPNPMNPAPRTGTVPGGRNAPHANNPGGKAGSGTHRSGGTTKNPAKKRYRV